MMRKVVSSADIARVKEIPVRRRFEVRNNGQKLPSVCSFDAERDTLFCHWHKTYDNCTCTARIRLCGILTNSVVPDVKYWRNQPNDTAPVGAEV